ncbi:hypothetical protein [Mycolicibacterium nivoides]|uniref:hypothetical protein n=1 Tax=Mycolicibacterium nivoides TaxID=2487344 RepID=UPI000F5BE5EB|nr:hypothetical protein [Mycolicibacterium nivoides]
MDIVDQIVAAGELEKPWTWVPDHPAYHDGYLHLTREQWDRVLTIYPPGPKHCLAVWGIRVRLT